jgi:hypothetical protein
MNRCPGTGKQMVRVLTACVVLLISACSDDEPVERGQAEVDVKKPPAPIERQWYPTPRYPRGGGLPAMPTGPAYTPAPATGPDDRYRQASPWQSPDFTTQYRSYTGEPRYEQRPWGALEPREPASRQSFAGSGARNSRLPEPPDWGADTYGGYPVYGVPAAPAGQSSAATSTRGQEAVVDQTWYPQGRTGQGWGTGTYGEYPAYDAPAPPW